MSYFPSKWYDFANHKELRRLRDDFNNTLSLKIQIASSIILTIVSFFFSEYIAWESIFIQILVCVFLSLIVILIFALPYIVNFVTLKKRCNVIIKGKDAISIFDDRIVYDVLVACEYYNAKLSIPNNALQKELDKFYHLEIKYYITESIKKLSMFSSNSVKLIGDGRNRISYARAKNIVNMIQLIIDNAGI